MLKELSKRRVFKVLSGYAMVSFVTLQIADVTFEPLGIDPAILRIVIALLLLGLPIVTYLAWVFDVTPEQGLEYQKGSRPWLEMSLAAFFVGVLVLASWWILRPTPVDGQSTEVAAVDNPNSVAVLPFRDMSAAQNQAYFGQGIADQIINDLSDISGLNVASRTSSFAVDSTQTMADIGAALNVAYVLEGSVRKDEQNLRVTAQLIDVASGFRVWSNTFDRSFSDIFAIQEEIAANVVGSMGVTLGVGDANSFNGAGTSSVEAYELYLQGSTSGRTEFLTRAVEIDPNYAAAWSSLGLVTAGKSLQLAPEEAAVLIDQAYEYTRKAIELDDTSAQVAAFYGTLLYAKQDWMGALEWHEKAKTLSTEAVVEWQHGNMLLRGGLATKALEHFSLSRAIDGRSDSLGRLFATQAHIILGDYEKAASEAAQIEEPMVNNYAQLLISLNRADQEGVESALTSLTSLGHPVGGLANSLNWRQPDSISTQIQVSLANGPMWSSKYHDLALLAAFVGDHTLALELFTKDLSYTQVRMQALWFPVLREVRQQAGFKAEIARQNLLPFYQTLGWPDICKPLGSADFVCL